MTYSKVALLGLALDAVSAVQQPWQQQSQNLMAQQPMPWGQQVMQQPQQFLQQPSGPWMPQQMLQQPYMMQQPMQPMAPWMAQPQQPWMGQQMPAQPWTGQPQQMAPPMRPFEPVLAAQPVLKPGEPGVNPYIFHFIPDNKMCCIQGPKSYLNSALNRIRSSPLAQHYSTSQVMLGMCTNSSYPNGPFPGTCFPRAAIYTDDDPLHVMTMIDFDQSEAQLYASEQGVPMQEATKRFKSACDDGTLEQGLQLSSEEFQAQVYVPPMASLIPDNEMSCMQGTMEYLNTALTQIKKTPLAEIFNHTKGPRHGMCSEHGFSVGSGATVSAGHGRVKSKCFPKATMFWDMNATHHDQLMWVETRALKGPTRGFNWTRYEERRDQVQEMCGGKAETVYRPMPPNLR